MNIRMKMIEKARKNKKIIEILIASLLIINLFAANLMVYHGKTSIPQAVAILLCLCELFYFRNELIKIKPSVVMIVLQLLGLLYLVFGIIYKTPTYITYACFFIAIIPGLACLCSNSSYWRELVKYLFFAGLIASQIVVFACLLFAPISTGQYSGIFINPNHTGDFTSFGLLCSLYFEDDSRKSIRVFSKVLILELIAFTIFTMSRTTILASAAILFVYYIPKLKQKKSFVKLLISIGLVAAIYFGFFYFLSYVTPHISSLFMSSQDKRQSISDEFSYFNDRIGKGISDERDISSGRFDIWKTYISKLNFSGHDGRALFFKDYYGPGEGTHQNAHNAFIEVAYQTGYIGGIIYLLLTLLAGIKVFHTYLLHKMDSASSLWLCIFLNAFIRGLLSSTISPASNFDMFFLCLIVIPMILARKQPNEMFPPNR